MKFIVTFSEIPVKHCGNKKKVVAVILVVGGVVGGVVVGVVVVVVVVGGGGGSMCTKVLYFFTYHIRSGYLLCPARLPSLPVWCTAWMDKEASNVSM
jgi:hypothetical protein